MIILFVGRVSYAQIITAPSEDSFISIEQYAKRIYSESNKLHIYHGTKYVSVLVNPDQDSGHPFYLRDSFRDETIEYEGIEYSNVPLLFDLLQGRIVSIIPNTDIRINLIQEKISRFTIDGHTFVKIEGGLIDPLDMNTVFCDLLYQGDAIKVYAKRKKKLSESNNDLVIKKNFIDKTDIFVFKDNVFHLIKNKRMLMNLVDIKRDMIERSFRKEEGRLAKRSLESFVIYVCRQYDTP